MTYSAMNAELRRILDCVITDDEWSLFVKILYARDGRRKPLRERSIGERIRDFWINARLSSEVTDRVSNAAKRAQRRRRVATTTNSLSALCQIVADMQEQHRQLVASFEQLKREREAAPKVVAPILDPKPRALFYTAPVSAPDVSFYSPLPSLSDDAFLSTPTSESSIESPSLLCAEPDCLVGDPGVGQFYHPDLFRSFP
jgi:hypothetical protein